MQILELIDSLEARTVGSLSLWERGGVRGYGLTSSSGNPLSPSGEREHTEFAAPAATHSKRAFFRTLRTSQGQLTAGASTCP
jgi:hypothetical protein